ncbi:hypothetical protein MTR67_019617, partial [Solanum verrucosum]
AESPSIEFIPIISEFWEVFSTNLLGMPPDRNIDFYIDLKLGTSPISIPPYHMALLQGASIFSMIDMGSGYHHLKIRPVDIPKTTFWTRIKVRSTFIEEIKTKKFDDEDFNKLINKVVSGEAQDATLDACGVLSFRGRICIPQVDELILNACVAREDDLGVGRYVERMRTEFRGHWDQFLPLCKVQWKHHPNDEATWEIGRDMRDKYPYLFEDSYTTLFSKLTLFFLFDH